MCRPVRQGDWPRRGGTARRCRRARRSASIPTVDAVRQARVGGSCAADRLPPRSSMASAIQAIARPWRSASASGASTSGWSREAQHRALLRFGVQDHGAEVAEDGVWARCRVRWWIRWEHRGRGDLGVSCQRAAPACWGSKMHGGPRDGGSGGGGVLDRWCDACGDELAGGGDEGLWGPSPSGWNGRWPRRALTSPSWYTSVVVGRVSREGMDPDERNPDEATVGSSIR